MVYDAAVPVTDRDARERYVGWWLGANDPQVYVYSQLVYHSYDTVGALVDLSDQFGVDLEKLVVTEPGLMKELVRELENREQRQGNDEAVPRLRGASRPCARVSARPEPSSA